ncbi:MAG: HEAT repeat domain-containing protein [Planctomycetes bacterium]|nr:HEAT repeat domain-containing protein [Planctomycetota bacterium]
MKPLHTALLCLACSFLAAGATYALTQLSPQPTQPVTTPPKDESARIAQLESELGAIHARLDELGKLQPEVRYLPAPKDGKSTSESREKVNAKVDEKLDPERVNELSERLAEIEKREAAELALYVEQLKNGNGREQEAAAAYLGKEAAKGNEAAKQALRDAMKSEDADVREWAIEALNGTGLVEFLPDLKALMNDPAPDVREEITQTLESMPADQAGPLLVGMLGDSEPDVLIGAIEVLGSLEYKAAINDLLPLSRHENEEVALSAAIALNSCGDSSAAENWVPTLGARLSNDDAGERRRAVRYMREMGLESTRTYLEQAKQDSDWRVRREAERALQELDE